MREREKKKKSLPIKDYELYLWKNNSWGSFLIFHRSEEVKVLPISLKHTLSRLLGLAERIQQMLPFFLT